MASTSWNPSEAADRGARGERQRLDPRKLLVVLPSLITLSSIFCGFDALRLAASASAEGDFRRAALLILFAMLLDALDGRVARLTGTQSAFGLQIDSLADLVAFGVAPSVLVYRWALHRVDFLGALAAFVFTACGAIRLARFNVLSMGAAASSSAPARPSKHIVGLPIAVAAGLLVALVLLPRAAGGQLAGGALAAVALAATVALSFLMVSTIRFRSFKGVRLDARAALLAALVIGAGVAVSARWGPTVALAWLLGAYVLLGVVESLWRLQARRGRPLGSRRRGGAPAR